MNLSAKAVIALAVYLTAVVGFSPVVRRSAAPPLEKEFERMKVQLYSYYDRRGEVPPDLNFFPPELKRLVGDPASGISWDPLKQELVHQYPEAYPLNRSIVHSLTFGLLSPGPKVHGGQVGRMSSAPTPRSTSRRGFWMPGHRKNENPPGTNPGRVP